MADKCLSVGVHCASQPTVNHKRVALSDQLVVLRKNKTKKHMYVWKRFHNTKPSAIGKKNSALLRLFCGYSAVTLRLLCGYFEVALSLLLTIKPEHTKK